MAGTLRRAHRAAQRLRRYLPLVVVLVRLVAGIVAVQLSGLGHLVTDVAPLVFDIAVEHEDCSTDGEDDDCPPGCPNCHCSHGSSSLPPQRVVDVEALATVLVDPWGRRALEETPKGPCLGCIDRPPKRA